MEERAASGEPGPDIAALAEYVRARQTEENADWPAAVATDEAMPVRTRQAALRMVLGRVDALTGLNARQKQFDEAVALLEATIPLLDSAGRPTLALKLADVLVDRGVWHGSTCQDVGLEPDVNRALADLRRALELNPASARARDNLVRALMWGVADRPGGCTIDVVLAVLADACQVLHEGLTHAPRNNRLLEMMAVALEELELLFADLSVAQLAELTRPSDDEAADGRHRKLHRLMQAVRQTPMDAAARADLLAALREELNRRGRDDVADAGHAAGPGPADDTNK